jgi:hypothetical protein
VKVAMAMGTEEMNDVLGERLFFMPSFCDELFFIFAKVGPFLEELREKTKNPDIFRNVEKVSMGPKMGRAV